MHRLGILFLVPGSDVTLRVSGEARITNDEVLLEPCAVEGKPPKLGIVVTVEQSFFHCARAFRRSGLWEPARWPDRSGLATYGAILVETRSSPASLPSRWMLSLRSTTATSSDVLGLRLADYMVVAAGDAVPMGIVTRDCPGK